MGDLNLDKFLEELSKIDSREGIKTIAAMLLNELMKKEREIYLRESIENKANGYYERQLACFLGNLGLSIPGDRKSEFRPAILPAEWQKADESFFKTLKSELIYLKKGGYKSRVEARIEIFEYIECFYNSKRLHSALGYNSPKEYLEKYYRGYFKCA